MLSAAVCLARRLGSLQHILVLVLLIQCETLDLPLIGEQGVARRRIAWTGGEMESIVQVLHRLKEEFAAPLRIDVLAREVHMSSSRLHRHFKVATATPPLQCQKRLRLLEARRLTLGEPADVSMARCITGYESPSQFSREYRRLFGVAPSARPGSEVYSTGMYSN